MCARRHVPPHNAQRNTVLGGRNDVRSVFKGFFASPRPPSLLTISPTTMAPSARKRRASSAKPSRTTSKRKPPLIHPEQPFKLHPSFREGDVVLLSSDQIGFKFPLAKLVKLSPVFKDIANQPRPPESDTPSDNIISVSNASSVAVRILLTAVDKYTWRRPSAHVPSVTVLNELEDLADHFDLDMGLFYRAVCDSKLNVGIKYAWAYLYAEDKEDEWAMTCLSKGSLKRCRRWDRCPQAWANLEALFGKWASARRTFHTAFVRLPLRSVNRYGKRCRDRRCPAYVGASWHTLKERVADAIWRRFPRSPLEGTEVMETTCLMVAQCSVCAHRLAQHAGYIWKATISSGMWRS